MLKEKYGSSILSKHKRKLINDVFEECLKDKCKFQVEQVFNNSEIQNLLGKNLTYFTPTYNRAHLLPQLYRSLCEQTKKDFIWLIVDDGSSDNTKELVEKWIEEGLVEIQYEFKQNGGKHTAIEYSNEVCKTEFITDSTMGTRFD